MNNKTYEAISRYLLKRDGKTITNASIRTKVAELKALSEEEIRVLAEEAGVEIEEEASNATPSGGINAGNDLVPSDAREYRMTVLSANATRNFAPLITGVIEGKKYRFVGRDYDTTNRGIVNPTVLQGCDVLIKTGFVETQNSTPGNETYHCHILDIPKLTPRAERMVDRMYEVEAVEMAKVRVRKRMFSNVSGTEDSQETW